MRPATVGVLDRDSHLREVRCIYVRGVLAITEEVGTTGALRTDEAWRVVHLPTGAAMPGWGMTARRARRVLDAMEPLLKWERYTRIEQVAALGKRTKARLGAALAGANAPKKKGGGR